MIVMLEKRKKKLHALSSPNRVFHSCLSLCLPIVVYHCYFLTFLYINSMIVCQSILHVLPLNSFVSIPSLPATLPVPSLSLHSQHSLAVPSFLIPSLPISSLPSLHLSHLHHSPSLPLPLPSHSFPSLPHPFPPPTFPSPPLALCL